MDQMQRYSEPYSATGGLAAEGVLNQLGRPDIEPLEVLVREAVQNCWDAKRRTSPGIEVEIGRITPTRQQLDFICEQLLVDPPAGLPLGDHLQDGLQLLYFADSGTEGLGGPTRADAAARTRDFVDFVRNIGQPPDKDLGGGSFGYGKAAFYIASGARTIFVDTLCLGEDGSPERRFIGCALGQNFEIEGRPHTGRHWWGRMVDGVPEPLIGHDAVAAADGLGLPTRSGAGDLGTTVVLVAPRFGVATDDGDDESMSFIAEAIAWNFWPRMIDSPGAGHHTMAFRVLDGENQIRVPNPRSHQRLREFVEAMDRLRQEQGADDDLLLDRAVSALRPKRGLGRIVVKKAPAAVMEQPERAVPVGARLMRDTLHHVALMRNAELVVRYLPGPVPLIARTGYAGVFKCAVDVDDAFRAAEPPTHDDWVFRAVQDGQDRSFVKIGLERVAGVCREAAGYDASVRSAADGIAIPLGEFADGLAALLPGTGGPGARRDKVGGSRATSTRSRRKPGRTQVQEEAQEVWVDGAPEGARASAGGEDAGDARSPEAARERRLPRPQLRSVGEPIPALAADGTAVIRYRFGLRSYGNAVRLAAAVEIMASDGGQVESEAPAGAEAPTVHSWTDPEGSVRTVREPELSGHGIDGEWTLDVRLVDEIMMRVDVQAEAI